MITISCPIKHDFIIDCLEASHETEIHFKFESKAGMKLTFSVNTEDLDAAIALAKKTIKATEMGSVLYFQINKN